MNRYDRRLPHFDVVGQPLFVTFRLHGSLPAGRVFPPENVGASGEVFAAVDGLLDRAESGPLFLRRPEVADLLVDSLRAGQSRFARYELHAFVVMPNHVHLLLTPTVAARIWLGPLKGFTANRANLLLGRQGTFWQDESYDHLVRSEEEFGRVRRYIERNPVKAGLVGAAEEFRWSSASQEAA